jgi:hypothetical protein
MVDKWDAYEDFIGQFTEYAYFINSKYLRQVIFGNLNPKRQQALQRMVIGELTDALPEEDIVAWTSDEVVVYDRPEKRDGYVKLAEACKMPCRCTLFDLSRLGTSSIYVKRSGLDWELKMCPSHLFMQAFKAYVGWECNEKDKMFLYEGEVAKFCHPYDFEREK